MRFWPQLGRDGNDRRSILLVGAPVWVLGAVAILCLSVGFGVAGAIRSPEDAAALTQPPPEGLMTARVETRELSAVVMGRADVEFTDTVVVDPPVPHGASAAVVTGHVPETGSSVAAGAVLLEVSGRPVIVLPGKFPAYRTIGPGSVGPDVRQLRQALAKLGYPAGSGGGTYDAALARAVDQLYRDAGYPAPGSEDLSILSSVRDAEDNLSDARDMRTSITKQIAAAKADQSDAKNRVSTARKQLADAMKAAQSPDADPDAVRSAQAALDEAESTLAQAADSVSDANSSLKLAKRGVSRAEEALAAARKTAWTSVPLGELVFVRELPRRVDSVNVGLGDDLAARVGTESNPEQASGAVILTGHEVTVTAHVTPTEGRLVKVGGPAHLTGNDGDQVDGTVASVCEPPSADDASSALPTCAIDIDVGPLDRSVRDTLVGNVVVSFPVGRSSPDAVVVPVAAVSADASGQARVEVVEGELVKGLPANEQRTRFVPILTGLSAEGYVEVASPSPDLKPGDLVVIGRVAAAPPPENP